MEAVGLVQWRRVPQQVDDHTAVGQHRRRRPRYITARSFRCAAPCLWTQLPSSLRQPHSSLCPSDLPVHSPTTSSHSVNSPLSPSRPSVKTLSFTPGSSQDLYLFQKVSHHSFPSGLRTESTYFMTGPFLHEHLGFLFSVSSFSFCLVPCGRSSWLFVGFWAHVNIVCRIVSYSLPASESRRIEYIIAGGMTGQ